MKILKLLLQPLIENALLHGILANETDAEGIIRIEAGYSVDRETIYLLISDNGSGMESARLEKIRMLLQHSGTNENIGIKNVWERIKLVYGPMSTLDMNSLTGNGTHIRITFPAVQVSIE
ncbi:sensor histidine kinase [Paenibacillus sp. Soil750]|uniref:sensor histidine kinase n=1 Tax=Paenibacillus sp. Soil750 TaxID=1736398 RepID=UPI000700AF4D|nr:ATP-binding protein [Paenibacillus sp. Soil750]KRE70443.1 hypothetical protein ASL11_12075 [Paenibacillus sp. Soil750]